MTDMTTTNEFSWQNLYDVAREIGDLKPWTRLGIKDFFAVPDHDRDENAFVHVWGGDGDNERGVVIYPDETAFGQALAIMASEAVDELQPMCHVRKLYLSFQSDQHLFKSERRWLKDQGVYQRCAAGYPLLSMFGPRVDMYAVKDEPSGRWALGLLQQILAVCRAARDQKGPPWDRDKMEADEGFPLLYFQDNDDHPRWMPHVSLSDPFEAPEPEPVPLDFAAAAKLRQLKSSQRDLHLALMMGSDSVDEDEEGAIYPPCFPMYVFGLDFDDKEQPLRMVMLSPRNEAPFSSQLQDAVADLFEQFGYIPRNVAAWPESFLFDVWPLLESAGIPFDAEPDILPEELLESLPAELYQSPEDLQRQINHLRRTDDIIGRGMELLESWTSVADEFCEERELFQQETEILKRMLTMFAPCQVSGSDEKANDEETRMDVEKISHIHLEILPTDVVAPQYVLECMPELLADLMDELQLQGLAANGREIAKRLRQSAPEFEAKLDDSYQWSPAKQAAFAAAEKGYLNLKDSAAIEEFLDAYEESNEPTSAFADPRPKLDNDLFSDDPTPVRRSTPKIGRNDPCPCGSNKKYKKCCGR